MRLLKRLAFGGLMLLAIPVYAQRITATIRGTVTDPSQAAIDGAKVTLKGEDTGFTRTTTTNASGIYVFPELVVGSYRVEVRILRVLSDTKPVATQGPVWYVGGKVV